MKIPAEIQEQIAELWQGWEILWGSSTLTVNYHFNETIIQWSITFRLQDHSHTGNYRIHHKQRIAETYKILGWI